MLIQKNRGKFLSHTVLSFFEKDNIVLLCHINNITTDFTIKTRKDLKKIGFNFKLLKKKPILRTFTNFNINEHNQQYCNGTLVLLYSNNKIDFSSSIFDYLNKNTEILLLTTIWNSIYSNKTTFETLTKLNLIANHQDLYKFNTNFKLKNLLNLKLTYIKKLKALKNEKMFKILLLYVKKNNI